MGLVLRQCQVQCLDVRYNPHKNETKHFLGIVLLFKSATAVIQLLQINIGDLRCAYTCNYCCGSPEGDRADDRGHSFLPLLSIGVFT